VYEQFKGFPSPLPQVGEAQEIVASNTVLSSRLADLITDKGGNRLHAPLAIIRQSSACKNARSSTQHSGKHEMTV
jgi:hypothetical protein